ncbi:MAG: DUF4837 family protein [Bacteroidales bacterium]|nr:DUF4837 family protein [Bacteroidales bacterium]
MKHISRLMVLVACVLSLAGCKQGDKKNLLPNVSGKAGEVLVVIEREQWEGNLGVAIRDVLAMDTPYLAQREPLFNLSNVPPGSFNSMFKMHRNMLLININPQNQTNGVVYKNNMWAQPQALVQINAADADEALALFNEASATISEFFEQSERDRIIANSKLYEESALREPVRKVTGGILHFPTGYRCRKFTDSFVWIADEKQYVQQYVMIYRYPVPAEGDVFSVENIINTRNRVMQDNVPGMFEGSYMTTSTAQEPTTRSLRYRGRDFMETRGFWEVHGDFMGGPFVSHSFYSPDGKDIIVLEAFVFAPRYDKRQYLRQVEALLYSFEWDSAEKD